MSSDPPDSDREEITEVTHRAHRGDVLAVKIKHIETSHAKLEDKVDDLAKEQGEHKALLASILTAVKVVGALITVSAILISGIMYLIHVSVPPAPSKLEEMKR